MYVFNTLEGVLNNTYEGVLNNTPSGVLNNTPEGMFNNTSECVFLVCSITHLSKKHTLKRVKFWTSIKHTLRCVIQHTLRCVKFWTKKVCYFNSHILLVLQDKMAECFAKVTHEQEIRCLLDIKQQEKIL